MQPTVDLAKRLSQQRINPLVEESPELRALIMPSRSRDSGNTILAKQFPGGQLILTGANSAVGLRSMPARWIFLDEVDAYPGDIDGEGDPIALAEARTISFGHRSKVFLTSTLPADCPENSQAWTQWPYKQHYHWNNYCGFRGKAGCHVRGIQPCNSGYIFSVS